MHLGAWSAGDDCGTKPYRGQWEVLSRGGPLGMIRKPESGWIKSLKEIGDCESMSEKQEEREARQVTCEGVVNIGCRELKENKDWRAFWIQQQRCHLLASRQGGAIQIAVM